MLDLLVAFLNFICVSLLTIVRFFVFRPPSIQAYKTEDSNENDSGKSIKLITKKNNNYEYISIKLKKLDFDYIEIHDEEFDFIPCILYKPRREEDQKPVLIIYSHGNSGDLGSAIFECYEICFNTSCKLLCFEYPGYGNFKKTPSTEKNIFKTIQKVYRYAREKLNYSPDKIVLYGFSLGTAISFDLACREQFPVAGVILQAPLLSILRVLYDVNRTYFFDVFNTVDKVNRLKRKTFMLHGTDDDIVPFIHGKILSMLIPKDLLYDDLFEVKNAKHNNLLKIGKDVIYEKINKFIVDVTNNGAEYDYGRSDDEEDNNSPKNNKVEYDKEDLKRLIANKAKSLQVFPGEEIEIGDVKLRIPKENEIPNLRNEDENKEIESPLTDNHNNTFHKNLKSFFNKHPMDDFQESEENKRYFKSKTIKSN